MRRIATPLSYEICTSKEIEIDSQIWMLTPISLSRIEFKSNRISFKIWRAPDRITIPVVWPNLVFSWVSWTKIISINDFSFSFSWSISHISKVHKEKKRCKSIKYSLFFSILGSSRLEWSWVVITWKEKTKKQKEKRKKIFFAPFFFFFFCFFQINVNTKKLPNKPKWIFSFQVTFFLFLFLKVPSKHKKVSQHSIQTYYKSNQTIPTKIKLLHSIDQLSHQRYRSISVSLIFYQ